MSKIGHNGGPPVTLSGDDGWIARHRSVRDHWLVGHGLRVKPADPSRKKCLSQGEAWEDLTMECRYSDGFIESGGKKLRLERGTLLGAISWLGNRWNWTPQTVRTFLDKLEADGMIKRHVPGASESNKHVGKQATVLTVCNYEKYQALDDHEWQAKQQTNNNQAANKQQTSNNIYKDNKETKEQGNKEREERELVLTADAVPVSLEVVGAFEAYNDLAQRVGLPVARTLTPQRRKAIAARMREHGGQGAWARLLSNIERSAFLQGRNSRNWMPPGLDWFLTPANFTKVCEGAYGNGVHANPVQPSESYIDRMRRLMHGEGDMPRGPKTIEGEIL